MGIYDLDMQVIPLVANGKRPLKSYANRKEPFDTYQVIQGAVEGKNNVGLLTQPNFIFIDIDTKESHGSDGLSNFVKWCKKNKIDYNELFDTTLVQKTPTGGVHLIFTRPKGFEFGQDINFLDGVDIKASKNNYIAFAPSKIDGKAYELVNFEQTPSTLPKELGDAMKKLKKKYDRKDKKAIKDGELTSSGLKYHKAFNRKAVLDVFYTIEHGFGYKGSRNNNLFEFAKAMRIYTDKDTAIKYAKIANENTDEQLTEKEIVNTITSAYKYVPDHETLEVNGASWVQVKSVTADQFYVLESTFYEHEGSLNKIDYDEDDLYLGGYNVKFLTDEKTIYNYQKK